MSSREEIISVPVQCHQKQRVPLRRVFAEKEFWLLILLGVLYFHRPLFLGETFFFRDVYLHFLFRKQLLADFIHSGQFPLWDMYIHGGQPYWGELSNSVLYPFNLLYVFLPVLKAFNLTIVFHFLGCSAFTYIFSRIIGFRPVSSLIAGVIYGFCGYSLSLGNLTGFLMAMPYLPLLFLGWHLFLLEGKKTWFVTTVILGVFQVFAGAPEMNVLTLLSLLGWTLCFPYPRVSLWRKFALWYLLGLFIVGLASIQLIPTVEMIGQASRGQGIVYSAFTQWSLHPIRLAEMIFSGLLGYVDQFPWNIHYWGKHLVDMNHPYIISIYFGGVTIALASLAIKRDKHDDQGFPFKIKIFLLLLLMSSLILAIGRFLPFFHALYQYFPPIRVFRYPVKFLLAGIFPIALLAAYTSEKHFARRSGSLYLPSKLALAGLWIITAFLLLFAGLFRFSGIFADQAMELVFGQASSDIARHSLEQTFAHTTGIWILLTLLYQYRRLRSNAWQHWLLAGILILDLLVAGKRVNPYAPEEFFTSVPPVVQTIRQEIGSGRLFRTENPERIKIQQAPSNSIVWGDRWNLEMLGSYVAALYRIPVIFHVDFDRLGQVYVMNLKTLIDDLPWEKRIPLLSAGSVTLILTSENISTPGVELISEVPNRSNMLFRLYRNTSAANHIEFVTQWRIVQSDEEALATMLQPVYNPRLHVVLQETETSDIFPSFARRHEQGESPILIDMQQAADIDITHDKCEKVRIDKEFNTLHSARFSVTNHCDGYLVFSEPYYSGWQITVDDKPASVMRANYAFSAVFLPAGEHKVERLYRPNSILFGASSSFIFCCLLGLMTYKGWWLKAQLP